MTDPTAPAGPAPETATISLGGNTLTLGRLRLRQIKRLLGDIMLMNEVRTGLQFTEAQVEAMIRVVAASAEAAGAATREAVESFFLDADVPAYEAVNVLAEAYLLAQNLSIPKVEEKAGAPGEAGAA